MSKVQAPPSPSATLIPVTPPESPAVFHYSLPSPGLESPLGVFEALSLGISAAPNCEPWVEQVDFRLPGDTSPKAPPKPAPIACPALSAKRKALPSLDQITARLSSNGHVAAPARASPARPSMRLPSFLRSPARADAPKIVVDAPPPPSPKARPALPAGVGRLRFPTREAAFEAHAPVPAPTMKIAQPVPRPPASPQSPLAPRLQVTTTVVPRTQSLSPIELSESNLLAFTAARECTARQMLTRLRRRTLPPPLALSAPGVGEDEDAEAERKSRRHSAPPELPRRERSGFRHPVLELPGAF